MKVFYKTQKVLLWIVFILAIMLLINAMIEKYELLVIGIFSIIAFGSGFMLLTFNKEDGI